MSDEDDMDEWDENYIDPVYWCPYTGAMWPRYDDPPRDSKLKRKLVE